MLLLNSGLGEVPQVSHVAAPVRNNVIGSMPKPKPKDETQKLWLRLRK